MIDDPRVRPRPDRERRWLRPEHQVLLIILVATWMSRWSTLHQPLYEAFGFRQTQTAMTARIMHEDGISLLHSKLPVFGSPWEVPFEFPLFQASAAILMNIGIGVVGAVRIAALLWFSLTAITLFAIVKRWHSRTAACLATFFFCFSPHAFVYSRASLIEYCATAFTLLWLWLGLIAIERSSYRLAAGAAILGSLGALVKATTFIPWILPLALFVITTRQLRAHIWRTALLIAVPLVAAVVWTSHADDIKARNPSAAWLTSANLQEWNFGTLEQRMTADQVGVIVGRVESLLTGPGIWIGIAAVAMLASRTRPLWIGIALVPIVGVGTFFNLYWVHDYYLAAVAPAIAMCLAVGVTTLGERIRVGMPQRRALLAGTALVWVAMTLWYSGHTWRLAWDKVGPPGGADQILPLTESDDRVLVVGYDWSPEVLFPSNRWGMMYRPGGDVNRETLENLTDLEDYRLLLVSQPDSDQVDVASIWPWYGGASANTIELASRLEDIRHAYTVVGGDPVVFDEQVADGKKVVDETTLVCDATSSVVLPGGTGPLWVRTQATDVVRFIQAGLPVVPAGAGIVVLPNAEGARTEFPLLCSGGGQVRVSAAEGESTT